MNKMFFPDLEKALYLNFNIEFKMLENDCPEHTHSHPEMCIVFSGSADHTVNGKKYRITAGDVFVINRKTAHAFSNVKKLYNINIYLRDFSIFRNFGISSLSGYGNLYSPRGGSDSSFISRLHLNSEELDFCRLLCVQIVNDFGIKENNNKNIVSSYMNCLTAFLSRAYEKDYMSRLSRYEPVFPAMQFIEENFTNNITLSDISDKCSLSARHLCRLFTEYYGISPTEKIIDLRIEKARQLLKNTDMSITRIAEKCGYSDSSFFSKQFKKRSGYSPSFYRKAGEAKK